MALNDWLEHSKQREAILVEAIRRHDQVQHYCERRYLMTCRTLVDCILKVRLSDLPNDEDVDASSDDTAESVGERRGERDDGVQE